VFWFRTPLALAALLLLPLLPARQRGVGQASQTRTARFDWAGAIGLSALLTSLMLGLAELSRPDASLWVALALLAGGVGATILWVRHESRAAHPVLRMAPFRSARFSGTQAASVLINLACFANLLLLPYELTRAAGTSLASAGLMLSMYPGGSVLGSLIAGRLAGRWSSSRLMAMGWLGAAAGLLLTGGLLSTGSAPAALILGMLASGLGLGMFQVGYMEATTTLLPIDERGVAGSLVSVTRLLGILLGATGIHWLQGLTQDHASTFKLLGIALLALAVLFALGKRRAAPG
jgi:predicted MFS family arabinose efflux permease